MVAWLGPPPLQSSWAGHGCGTLWKARWGQGHKDLGLAVLVRGCARGAPGAAGKDAELTALAQLHRADILRGNELEIELN